MRQYRGGDRQCQRTDRQVDVEDPSSRQVIDEEAAEQRTDHARYAEHRAENALVLAALAWTHQVGDDSLRSDDQSAATEPLHRPEPDRLDDVPADARQHRAHQENRDRHREDLLAAVQVAELAPPGWRSSKSGDRR